ncbi:MAG TPA: hypothetical protein DD670_15655 [Planctomycetaceae bacterium]|nr:hypothetical protein [Planctomycetaceae bacterium]
MNTSSADSPTFVAYDEARRAIADGDLLLFRGRGLIATAGRGVHSHAAKAAWWDDDLFCLEFRAFRGGRAVLLSHLVQRWPGRIDVFETNPEGRWPNYDRAEATRAMRRLTGLEYGWVNVLRVALTHAPVVRWFRATSEDDARTNDRPPFCSQAVVMADRIGGGVDPVPRLADRRTEPADLARSPFYRYRFTLVP